MDRRNHVSGQTGVTGSNPVLTTSCILPRYASTATCIRTYNLPTIYHVRYYPRSGGTV